MVSEKLTYRFSECDSSMKDLLGGKGAGLGEMSKIGLPVPPGFVIPTSACHVHHGHTSCITSHIISQVTSRHCADRI